MTYGEMRTLIDALLDKAGSPYFNDDEVSNFLNIAFDDLVENEYERFESNQEHKLRILGLQRPFIKANSDRIVIPTDVVNFRYLLDIESGFNAVDCNGNAIVIYRNVKPSATNNIDVINRDPFNKPIDKDPFYLFLNDGTNKYIKIYSETTPVSITGNYLKNFIPIDISSTATNFELEDKIARELCQLAVKKMEVNIENYNRAQMEVQEIKQISGSFS